MIGPVLHSAHDTWAPLGATFYYGDKIPQWKGKFFVAGLRREHLLMVSFDQNNQVTSHEKLFLGEFGRLRDVVESPDGHIYVLTSNTDGRGTPLPNDDKILRIMPISQINSFEQCVDAGNPVMESYPRQCTTKDGKHFVEEISKIPKWIKNVFVWYGQDKVSQDELLNAIKFLINQEILRLD